MRKGPLQVTCAIIVREGRVLAAQRSANMKHPLKWEFPGGKIEANETAEGCIVREIAEELQVHIRILQKAPPHPFPHQQPRIVLYPFIAEIEGGTMKLTEHAQVMWCDVTALRALDWGEADVGIVEWIINDSNLIP